MAEIALILGLATLVISGLSLWFTRQARRNWRAAEANWRRVAELRDRRTKP